MYFFSMFGSLDLEYEDYKNFLRYIFGNIMLKYVGGSCVGETKKSLNKYLFKVLFVIL